MKKLLLPIIFLFWMAFILVAFFVVQKPDFLQLLSGLKNLFLIIFIPLTMLTLAACLGAYLLPESDPIERLMFGMAIGMGIWGLLGFGLAIFGMAKPFIILMIFLALTGYFLFTGILTRVWSDAKYTAEEIYASTERVARWIPISAAIALGLTFLMSLAPPIEDFDALLYHLTVPEWWLRDGGLIPSRAFIYWYPHIVEGSFVFPMALGVDTATHLIHFLWLALTILILWYWTQQVWSDAIAWDAIIILLTMPSLPWLASWAYTDFSLTFTGIATLYSLWKWRNTGNARWVISGGIMAGLAMGMKYTSFVVPLVGVGLIILWEQGNLQKFKRVFLFSLAAALVASPWYIRNWIWMGNPIYPFVFGGRFWDSFLAQKFAAAGSGIGFDIGTLLLLPLTATLGTQDTNFFDGRFGPIFLILSPLALYVFWQARHEEDRARWLLQAIGIFSLSGIVFWIWGVINSSHLFQTRYLFPALIPLTIPLALGLSSLDKLNSRYLKIEFIVRAMLLFTVCINLLNFGLHVLVRNPLAVAIQAISRQQYMEKCQPDYASALLLIKKAPDNANVYFLFEPRSYGMKTRVEPDVINANFAHDLWLYKTPEKIMTAWKEQGYTHVLLSNTGANFVLQNTLSPLSEEKLQLEQMESLLTKIASSANGSYVLYKIP